MGGPDLKIAVACAEHAFANRDSWSSAGRQGMGDQWSLQLKYMLAKFVFPNLGYKGWVGLSAAELEAKALPFRLELTERWNELKNSDPNMGSTGKPFQKHKWCDLMYFTAQDHCMGSIFNDNEVLAAHRLACMGFVRATCSRGGASGKDWFDRAGLQLQR